MKQTDLGLPSCDADLGIQYVLNYAVWSPGHHQVFVSVTRANEEQIGLKMTRSQHLSSFSSKVGVANSEFSAWS